MRSFVPLLTASLRLPDPELVEKDVRLHLLLRSLTEDPSVGPRLVFKGGTCLIKCYLDYPRFSADLDFTWSPGGTSSPIPCTTHAFRRAIRPAQRELVDRLTEYAKSAGFAPLRADAVEYGRSNRMLSANLHYTSIGDLPGLIKVQINYEELMLFPVRSVSAKSLVKGALPRAFRLLDGDLALRYSNSISLAAYDPREILAEKSRAILTRTAAKGRDVLDLYLLERELGFRVEDFEKEISLKTQHAAVRSARYRQRLAETDARFQVLREEDVTPLLLKPLNLGRFEAYRQRVLPFLARLADRLQRPLRE